MRICGFYRSLGETVSHADQIENISRGMRVNISRCPGPFILQNIKTIQYYVQNIFLALNRGPFYDLAGQYIDSKTAQQELHQLASEIDTLAIEILDALFSDDIVAAPKGLAWSPTARGFQSIHVWVRLLQNLATRLDNTEIICQN